MSDRGIHSGLFLPSPFRTEQCPSKGIMASVYIGMPIGASRPSISACQFNPSRSACQFGSLCFSASLRCTCHFCRCCFAALFFCVGCTASRPSLPFSSCAQWPGPHCQVGWSVRLVTSNSPLRRQILQPGPPIWKLLILSTILD